MPGNMTMLDIVLIIIARAGGVIFVYMGSLFDVNVFRKAKVRDDEIKRFVTHTGLGMLICASSLGLLIGLHSARAVQREFYEQVLVTTAITLTCAIGFPLFMLKITLFQLYSRSKAKRRLRDVEPDLQFKEAMDRIEAQIEALPKDIWNTILDWRKKHNEHK
jgi:hypothetical protein